MRRSAKAKQPTIGIVEWFRPGEYERVESVLSDLKALGITELRTGICWADWYTSEGDGWYEWLLERLAKQVGILPCFLYTPPCLGIVPKFSSPPQTPKAYADFIDVMISRFGHLFEWVEFWNEPNRQSEWDGRLDPDWRIFSEMIGNAAYWVQHRGKKTVLPGLWPADPEWLELMFERGVMRYIDAVGIHGFPGTAEVPWSGWGQAIEGTREILEGHNSKAQLWISQAGFSTWRGEELDQIRAFVDAIDAPVDRVYWQSVNDRVQSDDSERRDEREYHFGLKRAGGVPKFLFRVWADGGIPAVRDAVRSHPRSRKQRHVLITGGAGFIGTNLADRLLSANRTVVVYDDLSRPGVEQNVKWLRQRHGDKLRVEVADVRERKRIRAVARDAEQVFHFAAQVAVTSSLIDPIHDFTVNVGGTLAVLEELRALDTPPPLVFTSTNKVYGAMPDLPLQLNCTRYQPLDAATRTGINEDRPLDFHSPYGCSKGAAEQYVLDYARTFGIPGVVFRMSCIYGLHQMGTEDQGWIAHFLIRAVERKPIVIYGDGMQVRDVLFVEDLVDAFLLAEANIHTLSGQAFNIGGGLGNTISLKELIELIGAIQGEKPEIRSEDWRTGDQRYYVSDTRKFKAATGWAPKVCVREGVERLYRWLLESRGLPGPPHPEALGALNEVLAH